MILRDRNSANKEVTVGLVDILSRKAHLLHIIQAISRFRIKYLLNRTHRSPVKVPLWVVIRGAQPSAAFKVQSYHPFLKVGFPLQAKRHCHKIESTTPAMRKA